MQVPFARGQAEFRQPEFREAILGQRQRRQVSIEARGIAVAIDLQPDIPAAWRVGRHLQPSRRAGAEQSRRQLQRLLFLHREEAVIHGCLDRPAPGGGIGDEEADAAGIAVNGDAVRVIRLQLGETARGAVRADQGDAGDVAGGPHREVLALARIHAL